jgi:transposase
MAKRVAIICKEELHRSKAWAYKWLSRFQKEGLEGLRDKSRSGRPADVSEEKLLEIRKGRIISKSIRMEG